ncbi:MAG TPA: hypothetical protein VGD99_24400, partial [Anaerolineae bacterium]
MKYRYILLAWLAVLFIAFVAFNAYILQVMAIGHRAPTTTKIVELHEDGFVPAILTVTVGM